MVDTIEAVDKIAELNIDEIEEVNGGCSNEPWEVPDPNPCDDS